MTKRNNLDQVIELGVGYDDALALRRISMTLHRWHEQECGTHNGCIERNEETGKPYFVTWHTTGQNLRRISYAIPDRETGAKKRLDKIMANYPALIPFIQTDPRGCALYLLRPNDVPEGKDADCYYSRGIAVY